MSVAALPHPQVRTASTAHTSEGIWLRSPSWDLTFLILSAALVPIPLTVLFMWASIHVLHQITYINDCYVFLCLYPMATPQILDGSFQLGGTQLWVPSWATHGLAADVQIVGVAALFAAFFVLWVAKSIRDWRRGMLLVPSVLLVGLTIVIGFTLPLFENIDVALQGFNVWHSVRYLGLVWFLMALRKERGELDNRFVAECNGPDRPWQFYGLAVLLTAATGMLVRILHAVFGVELQRAYYIVILSTLLQHYYLDHLQSTKLGDVLGTGDRLLSGQAAS